MKYKDKMVAGLLAIFLGAYGIHHFYLGDNRKGLIYLLVTVLTAGVGAMVIEILGIIDGVRYLTMTDEEWAAFTDQPAPNSAGKGAQTSDEPDVYESTTDSKYESSDDTKSGSNDLFF